MPRTPYYGSEYEYYPPEEDEETIETDQPDLIGSPDEYQEPLSDEEQLQMEYESLQQEQQRRIQKKQLQRKIRRLKHPMMYAAADRIQGDRDASGGGSLLHRIGSSFLGGVKGYVGKSTDDRDRKRAYQTSKIALVGLQTDDIMGKSGRSVNEILYGIPGVSGHGTRPDRFLSGGGGSRGIDLLGSSGSGLSLANETSGRNDLLSIGGGSLSLFGPQVRRKTRNKHRKKNRQRSSQRTGLSYF